MKPNGKIIYMVTLLISKPELFDLAAVNEFYKR
jgi:hypothetical protein